MCESGQAESQGVIRVELVAFTILKEIPIWRCGVGVLHTGKMVPLDL